MGIGARIGELAKSKKISLKELSRRIDIPYTTLYHMVSRDSKVDLNTASKIADVLSIDINWLLNFLVFRLNVTRIGFFLVAKDKFPYNSLK